MELDLGQEEKSNFSNKCIANENQIKGIPHTDYLPGKPQAVALMYAESDRIHMIGESLFLCTSPYV